MSARLSDGGDMLARGVISRANRLARTFGVRQGQTCIEAAHLLANAPAFAGSVPAVGEPGRHLLAELDGVTVWGLDSSVLMDAPDAGQIVVTGSHGGLVGGIGEPARGIAIRAGIYHDAGICPDGSSTSRLPAFDERGVPAVLVSAASARISDARSCYGDGVISMVNDRAAALGAAPGMTAREFVERAAG